MLARPEWAIGPPCTTRCRSKNGPVRGITTVPRQAYSSARWRGLQIAWLDARRNTCFPSGGSEIEMARPVMADQERRAAGAGLATFRFAPAGPQGTLPTPGHPPGVTPRLRIGLALAAALIALSSAFIAPSRSSRSPSSSGAITSSRVQQDARSSAARALTFEPNVGQTDPAVRFVAQGAGYAIFLTPLEIVLSLQRAGASAGATAGRTTSFNGAAAASTQPGGTQGIVLRMQLAGANKAAVLSGEQPQPSRMTYIVGSDPNTWRSSVAAFAQVRYSSVYPGVDLVVRATNAQPEFDFVLAPGADPTQIQMHIAGAQQLHIASSGALVEQLSGSGQIEEEAPRAFQQASGVQQFISAGFRLFNGDRVGFNLGHYDRKRQLTIDPVIAYATYIGADGVDGVGSPALDPAGDVYVAGTSTSLDYPTTAGAYETAAPGSVDRGTLSAGVILSEFSPQGTLLRSTYFGGYLIDYLGAASMALGPDGVYIGGRVSCGNNVPPSGCDLPVTPNAFEPAYIDQSGMSYVAKFDLTLSTLAYSSYLGGTSANGDEVLGVSVDANNDLFVSGRAYSGDFPTTSNAYRMAPGIGSFAAQQGFLSIVAPSGSKLLYSTLFGDDTAGDAVAAGACRAGAASTCAYLTGITRDAALPTTRGAFQRACPSGVVGVRCTSFQAFVSKFDPSKNAARSLSYSSFLGGNNEDEAFGGIKVDSKGDAYVAGITHSSTFPTCPGPSPTCANHAGQPFKNYLSGTTAAAVGGDGFVTQVNPTATQLLYSTYVSGPEQPTCQVTYVDHLSLDKAGNAYTTGSTCDPQFPVTGDAFQPAMPAQPYSAFIAEINPKLTGNGSGLPGANNPTLVWSSYLGGSYVTSSSGITVDSSGDVWLAGAYNGCDFPVTANAYQHDLTGALGGASGLDDGILVKIAPGRGAPIGQRSCSVPSTVSSGSGALDPSFGTSGTASTAVPGQGKGGTAGSSLVAETDGKVIAVGTVYSGNAQLEGGSIGLARFTSGGALDATFGSGGTTDASFSGVTVNANAAVYQPDGKLLVAGTYWTPSGAEGVALARFHVYDAGATPGTVDTGFGTSGIAEVPYQGSIVKALVLQPDGKAVVGGTNSGFLLLRFHAYDTGYAPGSMDTSFGNGGIVNSPSQTGAVNALAIQPLGSTFAIVAGGQDLGPSNSVMQVFALRRYNAADGDLDTSFGNGGEAITDFDVPVAGGDTVTAYPSVDALAVQSDGTIVAGGSVWVGDPEHQSDYALARYMADGAADTSFGSGGKVVSDVYDSDQVANALVLGANGTIILAGGSNGKPGSPTYSGFASYFLIERFASNGNLDGSFGNGGAVETPFGAGEFAHATGVLVQSDGKIVADGDTCDFSSGCRLSIARYLG